MSHKRPWASDRTHSQNPGRCPRCGTDQISREEFVDRENGTVEEEAMCLECTAAWTNVYKLVRYEDESAMGGSNA